MRAHLLNVGSFGVGMSEKMKAHAVRGVLQHPSPHPKSGTGPRFAYVVFSPIKTSRNVEPSTTQGML